MSVVGELPIDIAGFSSPEISFDQYKTVPGHSRQPSHRRTASLVMYFDDDFIGPNPALSRPGTPPASFAADTVFSTGKKSQNKVDVSAWGRVEDLKINTHVKTAHPAIPKLDNISSQAKQGKPDVQELFGSIWGGADAGLKVSRAPLTNRSSRSSMGTPNSRRSIGSPFRGLVRVLRSRYSIDRSSMASDLSETSIKVSDFQNSQSNYQDDDCESTGTVVEHDDDSEGTPVSQVDDADMGHDLYTEDKTSMGDDGHSSDSIDEDEFPIDTIAESALESQKTQDISGPEFFPDDASVEYKQQTEVDTPDEDTESVDIIQESPTSPVVHSHTISDSSQQELDMPLPEIVTGSILQGLHDEISQKLADEMLEDSCNDAALTAEPVVDKSFDAEDRYQENWTLKGADEELFFGIRWTRVVPDKDFVENVQKGIIKAGEFVVAHWRWAPAVVLPLVLVALSR